MMIKLRNVLFACLLLFPLIPEVNGQTVPVLGSVSKSGKAAGYPVITLSETSLQFDSTSSGSADTLYLSIVNDGSGDLHLKKLTFSNPVFQSTISNGVIEPAKSMVIPLIFSPAAGEVYTDSLEIKTNDPFNEFVYVQLSGKGLGPKYFIESNYVYFDTIAAGQSQTKTVAVKNYGNRDLVLEINRNFAERFSTGFSGATIGPDGDSVQISITFQPTRGESYTDYIGFTVNNPADPVKYINVYGTGTAPECETDRTEISFGTVPVSEILVQSFYLKNTGNSDLTVSNIYTNTAGYSVSASSAAVQPGDSVNVNVTFSPSAGVAYLDTVWIASNANLSPLKFIPLYGIGGMRNVFSPDTVFTFDSTAIFSTGTDSIAVYNTGTSPLHIARVLKSLPYFSISAFPDSILPSDSGFVSCIFTPTARTGYSDQFSVITDDTEGDTLRISVSGAGFAGDYSSTVSTLTFDSTDAGSQSMQSFYIKNTGNTTLNVTNSGISGTRFSSPFSSAGIGPGDSLQVQITFGPADKKVSYQDTITITTDDPEHFTGNVYLSGIAKLAMLDPGESMVDFDSIAAGDSSAQSFAIRNTGSVSLTVSDININTSYFTISDTSAVIGPGDSLVTQVGFYPDANTGFLDTLYIYSNAFEDSLVKVPLIGNRSSNFAPVITSVPDTALTEDQLYMYTISVYDYNNDNITYRLISAPDSMTIDSSAGIISFTPRYTDVGVDTVSFYVDDNNGGLDTQTYAVSVAEVNDSPIITSVPDYIWYYQALNSYQMTVTDEEGDSLQYGLDLAPSGMNISTAGLITWTPQDSGSFSVKAWVQDSVSAKVYQEFTLLVKMGSRAPQFASAPDTLAVYGETYSYDAEAIDLNGDGITYSLLQKPDGMTIDSQSGLITLSFTLADTGSYSVIVQAADGTGETTLQIYTLHIKKHQPPVITSVPDSVTWATKQYLYTIEASAYISGSITYRLIFGPDNMRIDSVTGVLSWTPAESDSGFHFVQVQAEDSGGEIVNQDFNLEVKTGNSPQFTSVPDTVAYTGQTYSYDADAAVFYGTDIIFHLTSSPAGMAIDSTSGLVTWLPGISDTGSYNIVIEASDSLGMTSQQSYYLTVIRSVNNPPVISALSDTVAMEGIPFYRQITATDADAADSLIFSDMSPLFDILSNGLISFVPQQGQAGEYTVAVIVTDGTDADTASFMLTIKDTNAAPAIAAVPDTFAYEDSSFNYRVTATDADTGDVLTFSDNTGLFDISADSGIISFTPEQSQVGSHSIMIYVTDGILVDSTSFTLAVINTNDPPVITSTPDTLISEGASYIYQLVAADPENDPVTFKLVTYPANMSISDSGRVSWMPLSSDIGSHAVLITAEDPYGAMDTQSFTITVQDSNLAPVFTAAMPDSVLEDQSIAIEITATDPDGDAFIIQAVSLPAGAAYDSLTRQFTWTPTNDQNGTNTVQFRAEDANGNAATQQYSIFVIPVNDPPSFLEMPVFTLLADSTLIIDLSDYTVDPDNSAGDLSWNITGGDKVSFSLSGFYLSFSTTESFDAVEEFSVTVTDPGGLSAAAVISVHVSTTGYPPDLTGTPDSLVFIEDVPRQIDLFGWVNDPDSDEKTLSWSIISAGHIQAAVDSFAGKLTVTPAKNFSGTDSLSVSVLDTDGNAGTKTILITVIPENDPPEIIFYSPAADTTLTEEDVLPFHAEVSDAEGDDIYFQWFYNGDPVSTDSSYTLSGSKLGGREKFVEMIVFDQSDTTRLLWHIHITDKVISGITEVLPGVPREWKLCQNYPNPFNPSTEITLHQIKQGITGLTVFSLTGVRIKTLFSGELSAGIYRFRWDGTNTFGVSVASGTYIYVIKNKYFTQAKKMVLLK